MNKRMTLIDGIERDRVQVDSKTAADFIHQSRRGEPEPIAPGSAVSNTDNTSPEKEKRKITQGAVIAPSPIPVHVRVRPELASALKAASLDRELQGIQPFTQKDIIEEALEPWLKRHGYFA